MAPESAHSQGFVLDKVSEQHSHKEVVNLFGNSYVAGSLVVAVVGQLSTSAKLDQMLPRMVSIVQYSVSSYHDAHLVESHGHTGMRYAPVDKSLDIFAWGVVFPLLGLTSRACLPKNPHPNLSGEIAFASIALVSSSEVKGSNKPVGPSSPTRCGTIAIGNTNATTSIKTRDECN